MHNRTAQLRRLAVLSLALCAMLVLAACSTGEEVGGPDQKASAFFGGSIFNFTGSDGQDLDARGVAREIANNRSYDFTTSGFALGNGSAASDSGDPQSDFTNGDGTISVSAGQATVSLDVSSFSPTVSQVVMTGTFLVADGQQAIDEPGVDFTVNWELEYDDDGVLRVLTFDQILTGTDLVTVP